MEPGISIRTLVVGSDTHVIVLSGALDEATVPAVEAARARGIGCTKIVDLIDVSHIDELGAALLTQPALLVVADEPARRRLAAAGADHTLRSYATLTDAVTHAAPPPKTG
jgi:ABC-type transporter Mla MlaB component